MYKLIMFMNEGYQTCNGSRILSTRRYMCKTRRIIAETRGINRIISRIKAETLGISFNDTGVGILQAANLSSKSKNYCALENKIAC